MQGLFTVKCWCISAALWPPVCQRSEVVGLREVSLGGLPVDEDLGGGGGVCGGGQGWMGGGERGSLGAVKEQVSV